MRRSVTVATVMGVVAALAITVTVLGSGRAAAGTATKTYCAVLPDAIGLYTGNPVTQMGVRVGRIGAIDPGDDGVTVSFTVDADRPLPAGVSAVTRSKSVLADRSLELVGNYRGGKELEPSGCIPIERGHTPQSISQITGSIADLVDQLAPAGDTRSIEGSITAMSDALAGTGPRIATLMSTAASAARSPDQTIADIGTIITASAPLTTDALAHWGDIASIITKLPEATDVAARVLWPGTVHMIYGMQPVLQLISDIEPRYGKDYLYPTLDALAGALHVAAAHVGDISGALDAIPALAGATALVAERGRGVGLQVRPPQVRVATADGGAWCRRLNTMSSGSCVVESGQTRLVRVGALDLLVAGVHR
ncbi:MlaD family protein [Gordonia sp. NPDC003376]